MYTVIPMQNSSFEKDKPPITVTADELTALAEKGYVKIEATRVRYAILDELALANGSHEARRRVET